MKEIHEIEFKPLVKFRTEMIELMFAHAKREEKYSEELYEEFKNDIFELIKIIENQKTTWTNFIFKFKAKCILQSLFMEIYETPYQQ